MALFLTTDTFAYIDLSDRIVHADGTDIVDRGLWSAANSYVPADVIQFQNTLYVCLTANTNQPPTAIRDDFWSSLVRITGVTPPTSLAEVEALAQQALDRANEALEAAWAGTQAAADVAYPALVTAWAGTALAYDALQQAWYGTQAAAQIGYPALVTAWAGTATADVALAVAGAGTNAAYAALQAAWAGTTAAALVALPALETAWVGTAAAAAGIDLANQALLLAEAGTVPPPLSTLPDVNVPAPSVNQVLAWDGSKWIATDTPSQVAPGAFTLFLDDASSGTLSYLSLLPFPSGTPEMQDVITVGGPDPVALNDNFLATTPLNTTVINPGVWEFNDFVSVDDVTQPTEIVNDIYVRSLNGAETFLFAGTSPPITSLTPTPQLITTVITQGSYAVARTDKLLNRFWFRHTGTTVVQAICYHGGTAHDSHFHTPIGFAHNDLVGLQGGQTEEYYHTTKDQFEALLGTQGHPSLTNPYVTQQDPHLATSDLALETSWAGTDLAQQAYDLATSSSQSSQATGNFLVSGGNAVWISGYNFQVAPTQVNFSGTIHGFASTQVTLSAAHATLDRIDLIVADSTTDTIVVIEGTPSSPAAPPGYNPSTQFQLTFIQVDAASTQPAGLSNEWIYRENLEWTVTSSPSFNPNDTSDPYAGTKAIKGTTVTNTHFIKFTRSSAFLAENYQTLYLYIKPTSWSSTRALQLNFETAAGARYGGYVTIQNNSFGFKTNTSSYQLVAISMSLFSVPANTPIQALRITAAMSNGSISLLIDDIAMQYGVNQPTTVVPDATVTVKGIVRLAVDGETAASAAVQGNDSRLARVQTALQTAWSGTAGVGQVQVTAVSGSNTANAAMALAQTLNAVISAGQQGTTVVNFSQVTNSNKADLKATFAAGVLLSVQPSRFNWEDFDRYDLGVVGQGTGDLGLSTAWAGTGVIYAGDQLLGFYGSDAYESYSIGTKSDGAFSGGRRWGGAGAVQTPFTSIVGAEPFVGYSLTGSVTPDFLSSGTGWARPATIWAY